MSARKQAVLRNPAILLIALLGLIGLATSAQAVPRTVLNLPLNETSGRTAVDISGGGNNGTFGSGITVGQPGPSYKFTTGHVTVKSKSGLNPGTGAFSFSLDFAWNTTATRPTAAKDYDLMRKGLSSTSGGSFKMELIPAPTCFFKGANASERAVTSPVSVLDGHFHSITCRRAAGMISVAVDGNVTSRQVSLGSISNTSSLTIGAKNDGDDQTKGFLRNVKIIVG
ncbi:LamG domain-containing protein [Pengzhenrongella frigida]|nr:LamG domain-containing protein [Cellulomonas sp. HLT2-17]